jgi:hypothetical protein
MSMSGLMEEMVTAIHGINSRLDKLVAAMHAPGVTNGTGHSEPAHSEPAPQQSQSAANDVLGLAGSNVATNPALTEDALMALIEPHLDNATIKTAFQGVLAQMGIPRLPEARPDQYAALYNAFSTVIAQHSSSQRSII